MAIFGRLGFWHDPNTTYEYIPTSAWGFVIVTKPGAEIGGEYIRAYAVFRPRALALSWPTGRVVEQKHIDLQDAIDWYNASDRRWVHLNAQHANT